MEKEEKNVDSEELSEQSPFKSDKEFIVPYRERRLIKKHLIPRLEQRRRRIRMFKLITAITLGVIVLLMSTYSIRLRISRYAFLKEERASRSKSQEKPFKTKSIIFVAFSIDEKNRINEVSVIGYEKEEKSIKIISIKGDIYLNLLGAGLQELRSTDVGFAPLTFYSIVNTFPFDISFFLLLPSEKYEAALMNKDIHLMLNAANRFVSKYKKEVPDKEIEAYKADFRKIEKKNVEIIPCPTRLSQAGKQDVMIVDDSGLSQTSMILFTGVFKKKEEKGVVLVLNGSGVAGAGSKAAMLLISANFKVFAVRNAESFNYKETIIEVYGENQKQGEQVLKVLKFGKVYPKPVKNDVIDVSVIVGEDFARSP